MTVTSHLATLPEPYRSEALANLKTNMADIEKPTVAAALQAAFVWMLSPQGEDYWAELYKQLRK